MQISRFFGANSRDVLKQVREALGPDALIVSNRSVDGGVEVLATVDMDFEEPGSSAAAPETGAYKGSSPAAGNYSNTPPPPPPARSGAAAYGQQAQAAYDDSEQDDDSGSTYNEPRQRPGAPAYGEPAQRPGAPAYGEPAQRPGAPAYGEPAQRPGAPAYGEPAQRPGAPAYGEPAQRLGAPAYGEPAQRLGAPAYGEPAQRPGAPAYGEPAQRPGAPAYGEPAQRPGAPAYGEPTQRPGAPAYGEPMQRAGEPPHSNRPIYGAQEPRPGVSAYKPALPPSRPALAAAHASEPTRSYGSVPQSLTPDMALREEINALRGALETRMDGLIWGGSKGAAGEPVSASLFRALLETGFSMPLVRALVERLPADMSTEAALSWARNELVSHLPVLRAEDDFLAGGGVFALVGPTGVGKTTTLAKLAARCVAREGREQVAMLTTDNFRIGALEQLQIYGRLMGVPARSVRDVNELRKMLVELGNRKIILIDTTGISQRDINVAEQVAMLCAADRPVRRLLVLNASSQGDTLDEVAHAYRHGVGEDVIGCIMTKLDEASRLGAVLDTAIRHRLPIHYVSQGQKVPEHLEVARADILIDQALSTLERGKALYAPSEADFAALCSGARGDEMLAAERRQQWLSSALIRQGAGQSTSTLETALDWLSKDPACAQARSQWRDYVEGDAVAARERLAEEAVGMLRREFSTVCARNLLIMHGKTLMKGDGLPGGNLLSSMLMSDRGTALAAPAQNLMLAHGVLSSFPVAEPILNAGQALDARVGWLGEQLGALPAVHMLESGTTTLWQALSEQGASWVARSPGALRVSQDECPTTLNAVSKSLGYAPVGQAGDMPGLQRTTDEGLAPLALWASGTEVALMAKAGVVTPVRLVCARLVDPASNELIGQLFGLTNLAAGQADAGTIARWLVLQDQAKLGFRYMAHAWQALPPVDGEHALMRQGLMAGQLAAACWQLVYAPEAAGVMQGPLAGMAGPQKKLTGKMMPVALLKLFALLEMAA